MAESSDWSLPSSLQPKASEVAFDLGAVLDAVVLLKAEVPEDAFTAAILGTERVGNGIVIRDDGLILTIGYLITEAESIWITANDGTVVPGHALAFDFASGLGLVLPLGRLPAPALPRGSAATIAAGDDVLVIGRGGRIHALKAQVFAKREFAGYWEYLLDDALFTTPPHPEWSGAALVDDAGQLVGVGSLFVQEEFDGETVKGNMFVPVDLLAPILDDLLASGRPAGLSRPWLGMYTIEDKGRLVVSALADGGPAEQAGVRTGDIVIEAAGERVEALADLYRRVWRQGPAGTEVPLMLARDGAPTPVKIRSSDRRDFLKKPRLQ
ncbi:MAG: S1C family serine protease [Betaproteobacteria bacterium]